jgi:hypothetical protein
LPCEESLKAAIPSSGKFFELEQILKVRTHRDSSPRFEIRQKNNEKKGMMKWISGHCRLPLCLEPFAKDSFTDSPQRNLVIRCNYIV